MGVALVALPPGVGCLDVCVGMGKPPFGGCGDTCGVEVVPFYGVWLAGVVFRALGVCLFGSAIAECAVRLGVWDGAGDSSSDRWDAAQCDAVGGGDDPGDASLTGGALAVECCFEGLVAGAG